MNYKNKYLKYKNKYLTLANKLLGGSTGISNNLDNFILLLRDTPQNTKFNDKQLDAYKLLTYNEKQIYENMSLDEIYPYKKPQSKIPQSKIPQSKIPQQKQNKKSILSCNIPDYDEFISCVYNYHIKYKDNIKFKIHKKYNASKYFYGWCKHFGFIKLFNFNIDKYISLLLNIKPERKFKNHQNNFLINFSDHIPTILVKDNIICFSFNVQTDYFNHFNPKYKYLYDTLEKKKFYYYIKALNICNLLYNNINNSTIQNPKFKIIITLQECMYPLYKILSDILPIILNDVPIYHSFTFQNLEKLDYTCSDYNIYNTYKTSTVYKNVDIIDEFGFVINNNKYYEDSDGGFANFTTCTNYEPSKPLLLFDKNYKAKRNNKQDIDTLQIEKQSEIEEQSQILTGSLIRSCKSCIFTIITDDNKKMIVINVHLDNKHAYSDLFMIINNHVKYNLCIQHEATEPELNELYKYFRTIYHDNIDKDSILLICGDFNITFNKKIQLQLENSYILTHTNNNLDWILYLQPQITLLSQLSAIKMDVTYDSLTPFDKEIEKYYETKTEEPQTEELQTEKLQTEEPKTEKLQTEEPKTEELQAEELQTEEPQIEDTKNILEEYDILKKSIAEVDELNKIIKKEQIIYNIKNKIYKINKKLFNIQIEKTYYNAKLQTFIKTSDNHIKFINFNNNLIKIYKKKIEQLTHIYPQFQKDNLTFKENKEQIKLTPEYKVYDTNKKHFIIIIAKSHVQLNLLSQKEKDNITTIENIKTLTILEERLKIRLEQLNIILTDKSNQIEEFKKTLKHNKYIHKNNSLKLFELNNLLIALINNKLYIEKDLNNTTNKIKYEKNKMKSIKTQYDTIKNNDYTILLERKNQIPDKIMTILTDKKYSKYIKNGDLENVHNKLINSHIDKLPIITKNILDNFFIYCDFIYTKTQLKILEEYYNLTKQLVTDLSQQIYKITLYKNDNNKLTETIQIEITDIKNKIEYSEFSSDIIDSKLSSDIVDKSITIGDSKLSSDFGDIIDSKLSSDNVDKSITIGDSKLSSDFGVVAKSSDIGDNDSDNDSDVDDSELLIDIDNDINDVFIDDFDN